MLVEQRPGMVDIVQVEGATAHVVDAKFFTAYPFYVEQGSGGYMVESFGHGCRNDALNGYYDSVAIGGRAASVLKGFEGADFHLVDPNAPEGQQVVTVPGNLFREHRLGNDDDFDGVRTMKLAMAHPIGRRVVDFLEGNRKPGEKLVWLDRGDGGLGKGVRKGPLAEADARFALMVANIQTPGGHREGRR